MTLLAVLYDENSDRARDTMAAMVREPLPCQAGLNLHTWSQGPWHVLGRVAASMPWAMKDDPGSPVVVQVGRLMDGDLRDLRPGDVLAQPICGFGAGVTLDTARATLSATTDALGLFPLYYVGGRDWMLVVSSPWFARCHPAFVPEWDENGLAAILLTMQMVSGQTVWRGVRRLAAGSHLTWTKTSPFHEQSDYRVRSAVDIPQPPDEALYARLRKFVKASRLPDSELAMLLSGGIDSRLMAGLLRDVYGRSFDAITYGKESDLEVQCARLVSHRLGVRHHVWEENPDEELSSLRWAARLELVGQGMNTTRSYAAAGRLSSGSILTTGHGLDIYMNKRDPIFYGEPGKIETALDLFDLWGLPKANCAALRPDTGFAAAMAQVRTDQHNFAEFFPGFSLHDQAQRYEANFRQRFHVGAAAWRLSWSAYPVMPGYDAGLVEMLVAVPQVLHRDRELEKNMIRRFMPDLARLPVDRNMFDTSPLLPRRWRDDMMDRLAGRAPARVDPVKSPEQLRYIRTMNINAPVWVKVREELEPLRHHLHAMFDPVAVDRILPKPDVVIPLTKPIPESSSRKTLLGLMVLAEEMTKSR